MKLKYILPLSASALIIPTTFLISCSSNSITPEETLIQQNLVSEIIVNKFAPEIVLDKRIAINDIDKKIINFDDIDKKYKTLYFEILNFEIPEIDSKDTRLNIKISSKLDKNICGEYSFNVSDSIKSSEFIDPMSKTNFDALVEKQYLISQSDNKMNFSNDVINLVDSLISQGSFDITRKEYKPGTGEAPENLVSILEIPEYLKQFKDNINKIVSNRIENYFNQKIYQSNLKIKIEDIKKTSDKFLNEGRVKLNITIGNSLYTSENNDLSFIINSFATKYFDLETQLNNYIKDIPNNLGNQEYFPILLIASLPEGKITVDKLFEDYLYLSTPQVLKNNFVIGIIKDKITSAESNIRISISAKEISTICKEYTIKAKDIIGWNDKYITFDPLKLSKLEREFN